MASQPTSSANSLAPDPCLIYTQNCPAGWFSVMGDTGNQPRGFFHFLALLEPPLPEEPQIGHQAPGEVFSWPKRWQLTALDEVILAVPAAILNDDEQIGSVINCEDSVRLNIPTGLPNPNDRILIWLQPGQAVYLSKSCQAMVVPGNEQDREAKRFKVEQLSE